MESRMHSDKCLDLYPGGDPLGRGEPFSQERLALVVKGRLALFGGKRIALVGSCRGSEPVANTNCATLGSLLPGLPAAVNTKKNNGCKVKGLMLSHSKRHASHL